MSRKISSSKKIRRSALWQSELLEQRFLFSQVNYTVTNTNDTGSGSLRQIMLEADSLADGANAVISFKIPGSGVHTIKPNSALPALTSQFDLEGTTDSKGNPLIELDGQNAGKFSDGLFIDRDTGSNVAASTITGLIIDRFGSSGIDVHSGKAIIYGCRIGTNSAGTASEPNGQEGILLEGGGSTIGENASGTAFQMLISGNDGNGITITSSNNTIQNCLIGTDVTGTQKHLGNDGWGIEDDGTSNQLGEIGSHGGLVISGNGGGGIHITAKDTDVENSKIGTDISGSKALGNKNNGIEMDSANNCIIGSLSSGGGNIVSASTFAGIVCLDSTGTQIIGNKVGTNAAGTAGLGNGEAGVFDDSQNTVVASNLISANGFDGIVCEEDTYKAEDNTFSKNKIGTDITGAKAIGNKGDGILLNIGTNNIVEQNIIAFNTKRGTDGDGVDIMGSTASGDTVTENDIFSNAELGINLGENQNTVLKNDTKDGDSGPNNLQNYPVITSAKLSGGKLVVKGTINTNIKSKIRIELFSSPSADPSGYGEGAKYLGFVNVTTDSSGNASFSVTLSSVPSSDVITATATSSGGSTSEFSKAVKV